MRSWKGLPYADFDGVPFPNRLDSDRQRELVQNVVRPFSNDINIHVARFKQGFMMRFSEELVSYYIIDGEPGEARQIRMPREFVGWE